MRKIVVFGLIFICFGCIPQQKKEQQLQPLKVVKLNISEPSGITYFNNHFYIVSDRNGSVYKTSLEGEVFQKIKTGYSDLEGISFNNISKTFYLVNERKRKIIEIDTLGKFVEKIKVKGSQKHKNSGLEGICFDGKENALYVLNEKSPKQLLKLSEEGKIIESFKLDFSDDVSGICFDNTSNSFWVVSDESQLLMNINKKGELISSFNIPVSKAEGVIIHKNEIYIVSDLENTLYAFKIPN